MDPYAELGISPGASDEEIKSAYRQLAKKYHPDANPQDEQSAEKMNRINIAYRMLREGIPYEVELDEDWYREQAQEEYGGQSPGSRRKSGIFYNPIFRSVVVIGIVVCMVVMGVVSSFYSALWAKPVETEDFTVRNNEEGQKETEGLSEMKVVYFAGGCFWGTQKFFDQFDGVVSTEVGYANGPEEEPLKQPPTYEEVCRNSGHAEVVRVEYDMNIISLTKLVTYFFMTIDPTSINRQGNDIGAQYRTGIYYTDINQVDEIQAQCDCQKQAIGVELAVEVMPIKNYYPAEEYHQKYLGKNP